jgi:hypothetical protein
MNRTIKAFRLIVIRRPYQRNLFGEEEASLKYTIIATNRNESAEEVVNSCLSADRGTINEGNIVKIE